MNIDFVTGVIIGAFFGALIAFCISWVIAIAYERKGNKKK